MYEQMYEIDEVIEFFNNEFNETNVERIIDLYNKISNPQVRVNSKDKQWVAYVTQASEDTTVVNAIKEILNINDFNWKYGGKKDEVSKAIDEVGNMFVEMGLDFKPRIPFYILVLDKLVK